MAVWYEVEKSVIGINNFLDCNWAFHDFRLEEAKYNAAKDSLELFLKYDTMQEGVLLRFTQIHEYQVNTSRDYEAEWMYGSVVLLLDGGTMLWIDDDTWADNSHEHIEELKRFATWVKAERIFWAITDKDGNPVEMPSDRINQTWNTYGQIEEKHFELKEFDGNWNDVLIPSIGR